MPKPKLSKPTTVQDIISNVECNHIWLNAFNCINPSPKTCEDLGRVIIDMLNSKINLVPKYNGDLSNESQSVQQAMQKMAELTPMLYLSINKS